MTARLTRRAAAALALLAVLAASASAGDAEPGRVQPGQATAPAARRAAAAGSRRGRSAGGAPLLYWGAWIGSQLTGAEAPWDYGAVSRFEALAGKGVSLVSFASPFANCSGAGCTPYNFPRAPFTAIRRHGAIPFFSWSSASLPVSALEPYYSLRALTAGRFDGYIERWAEAARSWGHPFFLRFDWEMNCERIPVVAPLQRRRSGRVRRGLAPRPPHLRARRRAQRDLGVVPERRPRTGSGDSRRSIPATRTSTGPAWTATTRPTRGGRSRRSSRPTTR